MEIRYLAYEAGSSVCFVSVLVSYLRPRNCSVSPTSRTCLPPPVTSTRDGPSPQRHPTQVRQPSSRPASLPLRLRRPLWRQVDLQALEPRLLGFFVYLGLPDLLALLDLVDIGLRKFRHHQCVIELVAVNTPHTLVVAIPLFYIVYIT